MSLRRPSPINVQYLLIWLQIALLSLSATRATDGVISITPSGPAAGFVEEDSFNLTCTSDQSVNVTWALPILPNDELDNIQSKEPNDLLQRAHVTADREGDVFIAVLVVFKAKRSDTGRYTCHPVGVDPIELTTQFESFPSIHIFISWEGVVGVQMNPLKSVYVVRKPSQQIFVVPCFNYLPNHHISMVDLALQKRSPIDKDTSWESVDLSAKSYFNWSFADFKGIAIHRPKSGEYRCGALASNGTCSWPKWSLYSFFIVREIVEKEAPQDDKDQWPRIRPTSVPFMIFPSGSTFSLSCKTGAAAAHQWNVNWRLPFAFQNGDYDLAKVRNLGQRVVATLAKGNGNGSHSDYSVLTIANASHLDTGYYTCHRSDNDSIAVRQYVFIQDWSALIAAPLKKYLDFGQKEALIDCRATHPSVEMSLRRIADDGTAVTVYPSRKNGESDGDWSYNPFEGFKNTKMVSWEMEGTYLCVGCKKYLEGSSRHRSEAVTHELHVEIRGISIELTVISGKKTGMVLEGDDVQLTCRSKGLFVNEDMTPDMLRWHWTSVENASITLGSHLVPPGVNIVKQAKQSFNGYSLGHLTWQNISPEAAGTYKCSHEQSPVSASYILVVSSASDGVQQKNCENRLVCGREKLLSVECMWFVIYVGLLLIIY